MDTKIKNLLGQAAIVAIAILTIASVMYVRAFVRQTDPNANRSFSVSGEGTAMAIPDIATFELSVHTEGDDLKQLQNENAKKMNEALAYLASRSIEAKDIATQTYTIAPRYESQPCVYNQPCPPPKINGYTIYQSAKVKVRQLEILGDLVSGVVQKGVNAVNNVQFSVDDPIQFESQARKKAIENAKQKAQSIADSTGFTLGRLLFIDEISTPNYYDIGGESLRASALSTGGTPPKFEAGSREIKATMLLRYEIR